MTPPLQLSTEEFFSQSSGDNMEELNTNYAFFYKQLQFSGQAWSC